MIELLEDLLGHLRGRAEPRTVCAPQSGLEAVLLMPEIREVPGEDVGDGCAFAGLETETLPQGTRQRFRAEPGDGGSRRCFFKDGLVEVGTAHRRVGGRRRGVILTGVWAKITPVLDQYARHTSCSRPPTPQSYRR